MVLALAGVLWSMRSLNTQNIEKAFDALGLQAGGAGSPGFQAAGQILSPGEERFNICRTRITAIEFGSQRRIEESNAGLKVTWKAVDPRMREISTLDVEKWLTGHCQIVIKPALGVAGDLGEGNLKPIGSVEFKFVDGTKLSVQRLGEQRFKIESRVFESPDLQMALLELQQNAQFQPPSGM